jgi:metallo-beta-lactamase family protein
MNIKFCGAAREVTGSSHLIEIDGQKILLDCGLFQGQDTAQKNQEFLFNPRELKAVILSHAHIDHSGRLPVLAKQGYKGPIYCTPPTIDLCDVMLRDSARLQMQDAEYLREHFKQETEPLYTEVDVDLLMKLFVPKNYEKEFEILPNVKVSFYEAGHVFGSSQIVIKSTEQGVNRKLIFTGDLGRKYMPILNDPKQIDSGDILITESTYASHVHDSFSYVYDEMKWIINDVIKRGGKILIPGFSLERTQELVYVLHKLYLDKQIPEIPIFVDSPLATKISKVFMKFSKFYDDQSFRDFLGKAKSPFAFKNLKYLTRKKESQQLNHFEQPCIIIAGSGMCTGGRILHHLRNQASNDKNLILIVGYMAKGTLGRRIVEQKRKIKIFNEYHDLRADVVALNEFSGHADKLELLENIKNIKGLNQVFIVHGEDLETSVMRDNIYNLLKFKGRVDIPTFGEEYLIYDHKVESDVADKSARAWQEWTENRDVESY